MKIPRTARAILVCILTSFLFGLSFIFIRLSVTEVSLLTMLSWRHMIAITAISMPAIPGAVSVSFQKRYPDIAGNINPIEYMVEHMPMFTLLNENV